MDKIPAPVAKLGLLTAINEIFIISTVAATFLDICPVAITQQWPHYHDGRHRDDLGHAHRNLGSRWIHQMCKYLPLYLHTRLLYATIRYIWNIKCNTICPNKQNPYSKWDTVYSMWKIIYCTSNLFQHAHLNHTHIHIYSNKYDWPKRLSIVLKYIFIIHANTMHTCIHQMCFSMRHIFLI